MIHSVNLASHFDTTDHNVQPVMRFYGCSQRLCKRSYKNISHLDHKSTEYTGVTVNRWIIHRSVS